MLLAAFAMFVNFCTWNVRVVHVVRVGVLRIAMCKCHVTVYPVAYVFASFYTAAIVITALKIKGIGQVTYFQIQFQVCDCSIDRLQTLYSTMTSMLLAVIRYLIV